MQLEGRTVLVTGGAGFIGSHLVDALLAAKPREVRVLDDFSTGNAHNLEQTTGRSDVRIIRGDVRDAAAVATAMDGASVVFHLACRGVRHSIGNPRESHDVNAGGTITVLAEASKLGVERFVDPG